jgi:hypothetical protein
MYQPGFAVYITLGLASTNMEVINKGDLADMVAILADLDQSNACADIILQGRFKEDMRVRRALYESALISYRRAINSGSTRLPEHGSKLWKFPQNIIMKAISGLETEANDIKIVADKCIAHRANADARRVEFPCDGSSIVRTIYKERLDLMPALQTITKRYINSLQCELIPSKFKIPGLTNHSSGQAAE